MILPRRKNDSLVPGAVGQEHSCDDISDDGSVAEVAQITSLSKDLSGGLADAGSGYGRGVEAVVYGAAEKALV